MRTINKAILILLVGVFALEAQAKDIIHDAEYYILEAQNGKVWAVEDGKLDEKIAELREKNKLASEKLDTRINQIKKILGS